ncbi:MAG: hypothetical protein SVM86_07825 [Candidatus Cloacimonadota bacterium]|nr:hypothetical protein [Candidatus Cloacimonadota bacterium]
MGKVIIISILILASILSAVSLSLANKLRQVPKTIIENVAENEAESLADYALNFAIKKLRATEVSITDSLLKLSYTDFNIGNGKIDSLVYHKITSNEIKISSYTSTTVSDQ